MKQPHNIFGMLTAASAIVCVMSGYAAAAEFMSKYGEIQTVKNYSSNPFWTSDSPYNSRIPRPIYATGADLNTAECNSMVENLVTSYCALNNNCKNMRIADVRPKIMVQLSQLPGHNYATSCGGYIDSIFDNYQKNHGATTSPVIRATNNNKTTSTLNVTVQNPYTIKPTEYQSGVAERAAELRELQAINATPTELNATVFPKTAADLSISDTMALRSAGYEPYKDNKAYRTIELESEEEYLNRLKQVNHDAYCERMPTTKECMPHIYYETYGGTPTSHEPTQYVIGRGATISWAPVRDNSVFDGWCTDYTKTNCAYSQTIGKNERDDKTFYAKWHCTDPSFTETPTACIDPIENIEPPVNSNCPDPHMVGANCECIGNFKHNPSNHDQCICVDSTKFPENNCEDGPTPSINGPQCLEKIFTDPRLSGSFDILPRLDITTLKDNGMYQTFAEAVYNFCVGNLASQSDLTEFNHWLDSGKPLPIVIPYKGSNQVVNFDPVDLFNYVNAINFYPIVIKNAGPIRLPQDTIQNSDVSTGNIGKSCAHIYSHGVSQPVILSLITNSGVEKAAETVYPSFHTVYALNNTPRRTHAIQGTLVSAVIDIWDFVNPYAFDLGIITMNPVFDKNYAEARSKITKFAQALKTGKCAGQNLVVYMVTYDDSTKKATIKSEPFLVP